MWDSLFGSAVAPAVASGVGEAAVQTAVPTLTDTMLNTGVDQALAGTLPSTLGTSTAGLGMDGTFQALGNAPMFTADGMMLPATDGMFNVDGLPIAESNLAQSNGMFDSLGAFGKALGSDQAKNIATIGFGGYNAYNTGKALNSAKDIQRQQLQQSQDAYNRDKTADQRRQKLVF